MGITPIDIQTIEFERSFRGYDIDDVDDFLDQVAKDLEQLMRENLDLKEQVKSLLEKNKSYQQLEDAMHAAVVVAQDTAEEAKRVAKREADLIRRDAEKEAQRIIDEARQRSGKIIAEKGDLIRQVQIFKLRFRSFMEAQLSALESEDWFDSQPKDVRQSEKMTGEETKSKP